MVVVPCNVDIATTEALRMAQEVDPEGDRTIGEKREESKKLVGSLSVEKHPRNAEGVSWHTRRVGVCTRQMETIEKLNRAR